MSNVVLFPESPELAWKRGSEFNLQAIIDSLIKVGHRDVASALKTFPLAPYMPKQITPDGKFKP